MYRYPMFGMGAIESLTKRLNANYSQKYNIIITGSKLENGACLQKKSMGWPTVSLGREQRPVSL